MLNFSEPRGFVKCKIVGIFSFHSERWVFAEYRSVCRSRKRQGLPCEGGDEVNKLTSSPLGVVKKSYQICIRIEA